MYWGQEVEDVEENSFRRCCRNEYYKIQCLSLFIIIIISCPQSRPLSRAVLHLNRFDLLTGILIISYLLSCPLPLSLSPSVSVSLSKKCNYVVSQLHSQSVSSHVKSRQVWTERKKKENPRKLNRTTRNMLDTKQPVQSVAVVDGGGWWNGVEM